MATYKYGSGGGGAGRVTAQKNADKEKKKNSPGTVSRILDVISRGQYASAGAALGKGPGESLSMAWKGLQGKQKTSYSQVLKERLGVKNRAALAVGGFIGDVALDPTTYVGVGLGKTALQQATKGVAKGLGKTTAKKSYVSTGAKAIQDARKLEAAAPKLAAKASPVGKKGGSTLAKGGATLAPKGATRATPQSVIDDILNPSPAPIARSAESAAFGTAKAANAAQPAVAAVKTAGPLATAVGKAALPGAATGRAVQFKVLGKTVAQSEGLYKAGAKVLKPIADRPTAQLLGRTFQTGHGLPQHMRNVQRKSAGVGAQDFAKTLGDIKTTFSGTTKAERRTITSAIERGTLDTLDERLRPLAEAAQTHMDTIRPKEGIGDPGMKLLDDDEFQVASATGAKKMAVDGLPKDVRPIDEVLAKAYDKHYTTRAYSDFQSEVTRRFGDELNEPGIKEALERTKAVFAPGSKEGAEWTRKFDKVQGIWKMAVTAPNPGFHIRNLMGDSYLNYLDGVVDPRVYQKAVGVLKNGKGVKVRVGSQTLGADDVMRLYQEHGLQSRFTRTENIVGGVGNKVTEGIGKVSDFREDMSRIAHFIDALGKEGKHLPLADAAEAAAARVRKFNIDYGDLTEMEKKFKRGMPFYTFARKALPTQLEMTFTRPGRVAVLPKGKRAIEQLVGARDASDDEALPGVDEALPPWMRDQMTVSRGNNKVWTPDLPIDLLGEYSNPVEGALNGMSPFIKGPVELTTGKTIPSGFNQKEGVVRYVFNQTPISRLVAGKIAGDEDMGNKTKRYATGPLMTKIVKGAPERKKSGGKSKSNNSKSGTYRYGS